MKSLPIGFLLSLTFSTKGALADWTKDGNNVLNAKYGIASPQYNLSLSPREGLPGTSVFYSPATTSRSFLSLGYRNLGLTYSTINPQTPADKTKFGETQYTDVQLRLYKKYLTQEYFYQVYKGYYIRNSDQINPAYTGPVMIQRPDIQTFHIGANFIYNNNPNDYSMAAAFDQTARQTSTEGSWLWAINIHYEGFLSDSTLLPPEVGFGYGSSQSLQSGTVFNLGLGLGYGHTFVFKNFYFSLEGMIGRSLQEKKLQFQGTSPISLMDTGNLNLLKVGLGYNGPVNYGGLQILQENNSMVFDKMQLTLSSVLVNLFIGHRFGGVSLPFLNLISSTLD